MKPKDLKFPFRWEERKPLLKNGILYIPNYYFRHQEWKICSFFENQNPIYIEFCSGNGEWIIRKAFANPQMNWIAVEKNFDRVRKIWSKRENHGLSNLFIVSGFAEELVKFYLPKKQIAGAYINFPDPWPKEKHAKNRLFQEEFIAHLGECLLPNGKIHVVTDDKSYLEQILHEMITSDIFKPAMDHPFYLENPTDYGESWFERLWKEKGRSIFHTHFIYHGNKTSFSH